MNMNNNGKAYIFAGLRNRPVKGKLFYFEPFIFPVLIIVLWYFSGKFNLVNPFLLPKPGTVFQALFHLTSNGELLGHLSASLGRVFIGFFLALFLALPMGFMLGMYPLLRRLIEPSLNFLQNIPPIAWIPLFIMWLGIGESSKIAVVTYASFFPIFLNTLYGVNAIDHLLVEAAVVFELSPAAMVRRVYLPAAAPAIFVGMRLGLSFGWRALVAAELIAASEGLGYLIMEARELSQPENIFVGVIVLGVVGMLIDYMTRKIESKILPWQQIERE